MRLVNFIVGLILGLAVAVFALQNTVAVELRFLLWKVQGPLAAVVLGSAGVGALVALLFGVPEVLAARWRVRRLERRIEGEARADPGRADPLRGAEPGARGPAGPEGDGPAGSR
jgi:uncharacterized integral membrane protein